MTCLSRASRRIARKRVLVPLTLSVLLAACNGSDVTDTTGPTASVSTGGAATGDTTQPTADPTTGDTATGDTAGSTQPTSDTGGTGTTGDTTAGSGDTPSTGDTTDTSGTAGGGTGATTPADSATAVARAIAALTDVGTAGKTYYVATNGDDGNNGLSLDRPMRTVERAMSLVSPGDSIEVRAGTYSSGSGFVARRAGTANARIKIKAYNNEKVTLTSGGQVVFYILEGAPYWIVEGLEIRGGSSYAIKTDAHHVNIVKNNLHGSSADIIKLVSTSDDVAIYGNEIHHNNAAEMANAQGVDIVGADRTWVAHNYVHDIVSIGIYSKGNSRNSLFENNRLENIRSRALMLGQSTGTQFMNDGRYETYDGIIRNNVVINGGDACLASASSYNVKIYNNSCYNVATLSHGGIYLSNESGYGQAGTHVEVRNNIVVTAGRPVLKVNADAMTDFGTLKIENNVFWTTGGSVSVMWLGGTQSFDNWRTSSGKGAGSMAANPKYTSTTNLKPATDSPAVNAGAPVTVATTPYNAYSNANAREDYDHVARPLGNAIDIGAYEVN